MTLSSFFGDPFGDPAGIRTPDPQLRRLLLYPAELRDQHIFSNAGAKVLHFFEMCKFFVLFLISHTDHTDYTDYFLETKTRKTPPEVLQLYRALCAKRYVCVFKNKLLRHIHNSYHYHQGGYKASEGKTSGLFQT